MTRRKADIKSPEHAHVVVKRQYPASPWATWFAQAKCRCDLTQQRIVELTGISLYRQRRWIDDGDLPSLEEVRLMATITGSEYSDLLLLCGYATPEDVARLAQRVRLASVASEDLVTELLRRASIGSEPLPELVAVPDGLFQKDLFEEDLFEEPEVRIDHREIASVRVAGGELSLCAEHAEGHDPMMLSKFVSDDGARTDVWFTQQTAQETLGLFKEGLRVVGNWYERQGSWSAYGNQRIRLGTCTAFGRTLMIYVELDPDLEPRIISASSASQAPSSCVEFNRRALGEYVERLREGLFLLRRWG